MYIHTSCMINDKSALSSIETVTLLTDQAADH